MNPSEVQAWIMAASVLVNTGTVAWDTVSGWIRSSHKAATDAELNAILESVKADADRRAEMARKDSGQ